MNARRLRAAVVAAVISAVLAVSPGASAALPQQSGSVDLLTQANLQIDGAGAAVSGAGDVNGDGLADLLVTGQGGTRPPSAYVVFGRTSPGTIDVGSLGSDGLRIFGVDQRIAGAGDVNGDGLADLVVGAGSSAYVVFGKRSADPIDLTALGDGGFRIGGATVNAVRSAQATSTATAART